MAKLFIIAPTAENQKMEGSVNACLAVGSDESAARAAAVAAKPNGSFNETKFAAWTAAEIAATAGTLPTGTSVVFLGAAYGANLMALPGA